VIEADEQILLGTLTRHDLMIASQENLNFISLLERLGRIEVWERNNFPSGEEYRILTKTPCITGLR
jgi:hypothetical protein